MSERPENSRRLEEVESLIERFPDVPQEAVFKEDLLRLGVSFSEDALRVCSGFKPKSYFIFSFDLRPITEMDQGENRRAPEELALVGGPRDSGAPSSVSGSTRPPPIVWTSSRESCRCWLVRR